MRKRGNRGRTCRTIALKRESIVPLYVQLANEMRRLILSGEWALSSRIPSESELASEHGISRNTVRLALQALENEGLVIRQVGKGSFVADNMRRAGLHRFIAFVVPFSRDLLPGRVLLGVQRVARQRGYHVVFGDSTGSVEEENTLLEELERQGIRNYLIWPVSDSAESRYIQRLAEKGYEIVQVDRYLPYLHASFVGSDNYAGGKIAADHLIELGHQRIAFLAYRGIDISSVRERYEGYCNAMRSAGLEPLPPIILPYTKEIHLFEFSLEVLEQQIEPVSLLASHLGQPNRPTAIFAMNDLAAYLALRVAERAGLKVPNDLAVVGFDNIDFCAHLNVPLTSVAQDPVSVGSRACELLIDQIEGNQHGPTSIRLPVHLVVRRSTVGSV